MRWNVVWDLFFNFAWFAVAVLDEREVWILQSLDHAYARRDDYGLHRLLRLICAYTSPSDSPTPFSQHN